jgi:hypothetical protein
MSWKDIEIPNAVELRSLQAQAIREARDAFYKKKGRI